MQKQGHFLVTMSSCSVVENIARRMVQDVAELNHIIPPAAEIEYAKDICQFADLLRGQMSSTDATLVLEICGGIPAQLEQLRQEAAAAVVRERLNALKDRLSDEELRETTINSLELGDEFEFKHPEVEGRWSVAISLKYNQVIFVGLKTAKVKGQEYYGVVFDNPAHKVPDLGIVVRKVIKHQAQ